MGKLGALRGDARPLYYISFVFHVFSLSLRNNGTMAIFLFLPPFIFFKLRQHFHYNFVQKSSPLPLTPSFFSQSESMNSGSLFAEINML